MKYVIAIPSYRRPETICKKTLNYLLNIADIDPKCVTVFLSDPKEMYSYLDEMNDAGLRVKVVVGKPSLNLQRRFISNYYPEGTHIFNIEDDIPGIYSAPSPKRLEVVTRLHNLILEGFSLTEQMRTKLWGFAASCNPFYLYGSRPNAGLYFIDGACFGTINTHDKKLWSTLLDKEDYQRCLLYFKRFGSVVRLSMYAAKNVTYKEKGGMEGQRSAKNSRECAEYLIKKFPGLVKINEKRKSTEFTEILLIKQH